MKFTWKGKQGERCMLLAHTGYEEEQDEVIVQPFYTVICVNSKFADHSTTICTEDEPFVESRKEALDISRKVFNYIIDHLYSVDGNLVGPPACNISADLGIPLNLVFTITMPYSAHVNIPYKDGDGVKTVLTVVPLQSRQLLFSQYLKNEGKPENMSEESAHLLEYLEKRANL